ncbi:ATP-binding cassette domain-containing protein, partial [Rhizobium rhizogenes]
MRDIENALEVDQLTRVFEVSAPWLNRVIERKPRRYLQAVQDVTFTVKKGKCLALVGESGCGKSTVARLVTGLHEPTEGAIVFGSSASGKPMEAQMIFQDPHASLNPRWRVGDIIAEPIREFKLRKSP